MPKSDPSTHTPNLRIEQTLLFPLHCAYLLPSLLSELLYFFQGPTKNFQMSNLPLIFQAELAYLILYLVHNLGLDLAVCDKLPI